MTPEQQERAAVVKWLRDLANGALKNADNCSGLDIAYHHLSRGRGLSQAADAIEAGQHIQQEEE